MRRVVLGAILAALTILPVVVRAEGVVVEQVPRGGDLDRAGFQQGDIIYKINGNTVINQSEIKIWASLFGEAGDRNLEFIIDRSGECRILTTVFQDQGIALESLRTAPGGACQKREGGGLLLGKLPPRSDFARAGFRQGDIIRRINGSDIGSLSDIRYWTDATRNPGQGQVNYAIERNGDCWVFAVTGKGSSAAATSTTRKPADVCGMAEPAAPVTASAAGTVIEPRLGMEFARRGDNKDGAQIVRSWNTLTLPDGTIPTVTPGRSVSHIISYLAKPPNPQEPIENTAAVRGPQYIPIILDSILRSDKTRHDLVTLITSDGTEVLPLRLLPANSPAPAPRVAAVPVPAPAPVAAPPPAPSTTRVTAPSGFSVNVSVVMSALLALALVGFAVARRKGWGRGFTFKPAASTSAGVATPAPEAIEDDEEREIALARQAVEEAERGPTSPLPPSETGGPSWFQQQRERREVEQARRSMEEAEKAAARGQALPQGHYPYPPPPYGYYQQKQPLSEKLRIAYWGVKIVLVLVVAVWAWSVTGTVVSMLGAIVPAPLRAVTVDLLAKAQDAINQADRVD